MPPLKGKAPSYLPAQTLWSCRRTPQRQGLLPSKYGSPESQEEYQRLIQAWLATNQAQAAKKAERVRLRDPAIQIETITLLYLSLIHISEPTRPY